MPEGISHRANYRLPYPCTVCQGSLYHRYSSKAATSRPKLCSNWLRKHPLCCNRPGLRAMKLRGAFVQHEPALKHGLVWESFTTTSHALHFPAFVQSICRYREEVAKRLSTVFQAVQPRTSSLGIAMRTFYELANTFPNPAKMGRRSSALVSIPPC